MSAPTEPRVVRTDRLIDSLLLPRAIVFVCAILLAGLNSLIVHQLIERRKEALVRGDEAQTLQHRALLSQIEQTLNLYEYVVSDLAGRRDTPALDDELSRLGALDAKLIDLLILSRDGQIQHWSNDGPRPDVTDREYFTALRDDPNRRLYIGPVRASRAYPDRWFFSLSRPLRAADGSFDGVIVAIIDLSVFNRDLAEALEVEGAGLGIIKADGHVITRLPVMTNRPTEERVKLPDDLPPADTRPGLIKREDISPFDKALRRQTWTYMPDHELWVITSITRERMLSLWWSSVKDAIPFWIALNLVLVAGALAMLAASRRNQRNMRALQKLTSRLETQASVDPLTGAYNRRQFDVLADLEFKRTRRHGGAVSLLALDVDHFKQINDEWGHPEGDKVLQTVVRVIRDRLRSTDILARFGGEEFVVLMPHTDLEQALIVAETLRHCIAEAAAHDTNALPCPVTASFGVATLRPGETHLSDLIRRADMALYAAKRKGRNRVEIEAA